MTRNGWTAAWFLASFYGLLGATLSWRHRGWPLPNFRAWRRALSLRGLAIGLVQSGERLWDALNAFDAARVTFWSVYRAAQAQRNVVPVVRVAEVDGESSRDAKFLKELGVR
jgi:hypothetical protein